MIDNALVEQEINYWKPKVLQEPDLLELAFFKIFVKFEAFLIDAFVKYAIGEQNKIGFSPQKKLNFTTDSQLKEVITNDTKLYLELSKDRLEKLSKHIFEDAQNPFLGAFNDSIFSQKFLKMRIIRNFIAHESPESKNQYEQKVLKSYNITEYLFLKDFFQKNISFLNQQNLQETKSIFNDYIDLLSAHAQRIAEFNI